MSTTNSKHYSFWYTRVYHRPSPSVPFRAYPVPSVSVVRSSYGGKHLYPVCKISSKKDINSSPSRPCSFGGLAQIFAMSPGAFSTINFECLCQKFHIISSTPPYPWKGLFGLLSVSRPFAGDPPNQCGCELPPSFLEFIVVLGTNLMPMKGFLSFTSTARRRLED